MNKYIFLKPIVPLLVFIFFFSCISSPLKYQTELPKNISIYANSHEKIKIAWFWKIRPTEANEILFQSAYINKSVLNKYTDEEGTIIGEIPSSNENKGYYVVKFYDDIYFIRYNDYNLYKIAAKYIVPTNEAKLLSGGEFIFMGIPPEGTRIKGMVCTNNFQDDYFINLYSGKINFNDIVTLPSGNAVFVGRSPDFEKSRIYMPNRFPMYELRVCGEFIDKRPMETRSGLLRNFSIYKIKYILYYWGPYVIAFPGI